MTAAHQANGVPPRRRTIQTDTQSQAALTSAVAASNAQADRPSSQ